MVLLYLKYDGNIRMPYAGHSEREEWHLALDYASIGLRIKNARNKKRMTQEQLAQAVSSSREHSARAEAGDRGVSLELLIKITNALDVSIEDLLADALSNPSKGNVSELGILLLDCTTQEEIIITRMAQALKAILIEHGV